MSDQPWPREIEQAQFIRLTTFRRSGVAVPTPVWFVLDGDALLVTTMDSTGKAKRLRHTPRVTVCVSDRRGNVKGPEFEATAELLPGDAAADVRQQVTKRYGLQGRIMLTVVHAITSARSRTPRNPVGIRIVRTAVVS
jgi:PPOX class probable F420-dependent enzyme